MPLALRDLQAAFAAHLVGGDGADLAAEVVGDRSRAAARLRIYRHHMLDSLASALAATFPTVQALVGADFFRGLARAFVGQSLPSQPVLAGVRRGLPGLHRRLRAGRGLPYLADIARLDWALNLPSMPRPAAGWPRRTWRRSRATGCRRCGWAWRRATVLIARPIRWTASGRPPNPARRRAPSIWRRRRAPAGPAPARRCGVRRPCRRAKRPSWRPWPGAVVGERRPCQGRSRLRPVTSFARLLGLGVVCCSCNRDCPLAP